MGSVAVTGSVAYDTIMVFNGRFADHILADQAHILNVSFLVDRLERRRGGTAANIAYTMALLGDRPVLCATVGRDYADDLESLAGAGVDVSGTLVLAEVPTAVCFITTDLDDNQITAFHPGAMARAASVDLRRVPDVEHVVVAPDAPDAMRRHVEQAAALGARLVFAPAQQLSSMDDETLVLGLDSAWLVVGNDYELELVRRRTGRDLDTLSAAAIVARTRGGDGSELRVDGAVHSIPTAAPSAVVDPTGAGDGYLAGLLCGLREGRDLDTAGRMGALAAAYVIEKQGPQAHAFGRSEFAARFAGAFGVALD